MPISKYWEKEKPVEFTHKGCIIKWYPNAKQLQFFTWIDGPNYKGYSKGVTFNMEGWSTAEAESLAKFFGEQVRIPQP